MDFLLALDYGEIEKFVTVSSSFKALCMLVASILKFQAVLGMLRQYMSDSK